jgi:hypothetical protein
LLLVLALMLILALAIGSSAIPSLARMPSGEAPRIDVQIAERDLGDVSARGVVAVEFAVRNAGNRRLILREVACCGSTASKTNWTIQPGERVSLPVHVGTSRYWGLVETLRTFATNDPSRPQFTLSVRMNVIQQELMPQPTPRLVEAVDRRTAN